MTRKKRIVEQSYVVCDFCEKEIKDINYTSRNDSKEHYHSMYKGDNVKSCLEKLEEQELEQYRKENSQKTLR